MTCNHYNCNLDSYTSDGFCEKHKYWSNEQKYITFHINNYLEKIHDAKGKVNKIRHCQRLFNYVKYKEPFLKKNKKFCQVVKGKIDEMMKVNIDCVSDKLKESFYNSMSELETVIESTGVLM